MGRKMQLNTDEYPYRAEALYLAKSYNHMISERNRLKVLLDGDWTYTVEMAINDLDNTTVSYDRERVQSSGVSNPVQRIVEKIDDPEFMERKQAEMDKDKAWCEQEYAYICWKISIVHRARDDEMSRWEKQVFKYTFIDGLDYRGIRRKHPTVIHDRQITRAKINILSSIGREIETRQYFRDNNSYLDRLQKEAVNGQKEDCTTAG